MKDQEGVRQSSTGDQGALLDGLPHELQLSLVQLPFQALTRRFLHATLGGLYGRAALPLSTFGEHLKERLPAHKLLRFWTLSCPS